MGPVVRFLSVLAALWLMLGRGVTQGAVTNVFLTATNIPMGEVLLARQGDLLVLTEAVTNEGFIRAISGGVIHLHGPTLNRGALEAVDGVIRCYQPVVNEGTLVGTNLFCVSLVPQLYFQNQAGVVARWTLDRFGLFQYAELLGNMHEWRLMAAADIDGDGIDDLVWQTPDGRTALWFMDENFVKRDARFYWNTGDWAVRTGSSRTAGWRATLFFQRPDGTTAAWDLAADGSFLAADVLGNQQNWQLRAAAPRQRATPPDLLWQRPDGGVSAWRWNDGSGLQPQWLTAAGDWLLRGSVDIDGDGTADLIWQTPDQRVGGWLMTSNSTPREAHFWWQTRGWSLRAAGLGRLAHPLNPITPPDTNDTVQIANHWLTSGGTLLLQHPGGGALTTNRIVAMGALVITQTWVTAGGGFTNLLNRFIGLPTNMAPLLSTGTFALASGALRGGLLTLSGGGVVVYGTNTLPLGSTVSGGALLTNVVLTTTNVLGVGSTLATTHTLVLAGSGMLAISNALPFSSGAVSNLNGCTIIIGTNRLVLAHLLQGGNGVVTWPGNQTQLYTNNTFVSTVTLQLQTNQLSGEVTGTLNPSTDALALGTLTISHLFTLGVGTLSIASPITFPGIIYTNGILQLLGGSLTNSAPAP